MTRPVPGFPGYTVDQDGVVYSKRGRPLATRVHHRTGHHRVRLYSATAPLQVGRHQTRRFQDLYVHQVVAMAWHGPRPSGALVRHLDDDPNNNAPDNLRWGTHVENEQDKHRPPWVDAQGFNWRWGYQHHTPPLDRGQDHTTPHDGAREA